MYVNTEINTDHLYAKSLKFNLFRFSILKVYGRNSVLSEVQGFICTPLVAQNFMSAWLIFSLTFTDYFNGETSCYPNADIRMRWTN